MKKPIRFVLFLSCIFCLQGCSIKQVAVSKLGDTLAKGGSVYASDDDIELVGAALPFSLKTVEGLLAEVPEHKGLLLTAARAQLTSSTSRQSPVTSRCLVPVRWLALSPIVPRCGKS